jgi:prepilin-type N-terminal cleavage/methylation domain-containing protein
MNILSKKKAMTLPEIMVAALIITIAAGGTISAYSVARYFSNKFYHRTMAARRTVQIADYLRYRLAYGDGDLGWGTDGANKTYGDGAGQTAVTDADLQAIMDVTTWSMNSEVDNLDVDYTVSAVYFDNTGQETTTDTGRPAFKKIIVAVTWEERGTG